MLGYELDTKIQSYLTAVRSRGGLVSQAIAIATAEAIIQNNPDEYSWYRDLDLHNSYWAQSLELSILKPLHAKWNCIIT